MEDLFLSVDVQQLITSEQAWHYKVIPLGLTDGVFNFLHDGQNPEMVQDELELITGKTVFLKPENTELIQQYLAKYYRRASSKTSNEPNFTASKDEFLLKLLLEGKSLGASDIHIETYQDSGRLRFRIDGQLIERHRIKKDDYPTLINKIKIKSSLDITEKRLPQDGRIRINESHNKFDIRVSVMPTLYGEKVVLRYLGNDTDHIDFRTLGFTAQQQSDYLKAVKKPNGIILISGPTGSGKTTTLYATLKLLNDQKRNIVTAEDPVEYTLDGVNQVQLKESIGLTFAAALRSFLRQDPDIIMIGEIRDHETAEMAVRASLTGHLVLSTIHTNSAAGTIDRLIDMGIQPFLLASTLNLSVAQRLLRKLCGKCKREEKWVSPIDLQLKISDLHSHFSAVGCSDCYYTGYSGRIGIYEMISVDKSISKQIKAGGLFQNESYLNIKSLAEQATDLMREGTTSFDEVYPLLLEGK